MERCGWAWKIKAEARLLNNANPTIPHINPVTVLTDTTCLDRDITIF